MLRDRYSTAFNSSPKPLLLDSTFPHAHIYRVYSPSLPLPLSIPPPHGRGKSVSVAYVAGIECIRSRYQSLLPNGRGKSVYVAYVAGGLSTSGTSCPPSASRLRTTSTDSSPLSRGTGEKLEKLGREEGGACPPPPERDTPLPP
jgi:hypothetical protein